MFTGIVEELGMVTDVHWLAEGADSAARLTVAGNLVMVDAAPGDSIAVSGVCLTVVDVSNGCFTADVMRETLIRTTLADAIVGTPVNLERAATLQTRLGGHLVQGHVDAVGSILDRATTPQWDVVTIALPEQLARYVVEKGFDCGRWRVADDGRSRACLVHGEFDSDDAATHDARREGGW